MLTPEGRPGLLLVVDGRRVPVPAGVPFVVGRGPGAHLDLSHPKVSRRHLVLVSTAAGWVITDHSNGTYVGPHRVGRLDVRQPLVPRPGAADDGAVLQVLPGGVPAPVMGPSARPPTAGPGAGNLGAVTDPLRESVRSRRTRSPRAPGRRRSKPPRQSLRPPNRRGETPLEPGASSPGD